MLRCIYKTGSQCFLPKSNDKDYLYYYDTNDERKEALRKNRNHTDDIHFRTIGNDPRVFLGCYIYHWVELVEGEEIEAFKTFSIFNEEVKSKYVPLLKSYAQFLKDTDKAWYHILTACYLYVRGKYQLTKTELNKIQSVHDSGITKELKEYCINILNEIK